MAHAADPVEIPENEDIKQRIVEQTRQLEELKRLLAKQEADLQALRDSIAARDRAQATRPQTAGSAAAVDQTAPATANVPVIAPVTAPVTATAPTTAPVTGPVTTPASATASATAPAPAPANATASTAPASTPSTSLAATPEVAPIFQQPGVLTPPGKFIFEPSFQYSYSSSTSVALVGYTVIPAILVGLIDVRDVKSTTVTGALALRYGLTSRAEIEARLPYVDRYNTSISQAALAGTSSDNAIFDANGRGIGDIEFTGRYQFNDGGPEKAYYVGSLRVKTRTGTDPFQIPISTSVAGFSGQGLQSELPTGSGFYGIQPALTMLFPSDPAVFFGTVSALYSPSRHDVVRQTDQGPEALGTISPGLIFGFNFGMGMSLNDRSSFSIGYDHSSIGKTLQNGAVAANSVQLQLGTLLLGLSYRLDDRHTINLSLGAGLTRDTPDVTLTLRIPTTL